tara:strand:+ start:618 stop:1352 length:735 start_codon:yes stop_codon:yes gene_type:complete
MSDFSIKSLNCLNKKVINLLRKNQQLEQLIRIELVKDILRKVKLDKNVEEILMNKFRKNLKLEDDEDFKKWLSENPFDLEDVKDTAFYKRRFNIFCQENFAHKIDSRFLDRKKDLDMVVYSLMRISDLFKAKELFYRASEEEEDFGALAAIHSEGMEKKTRGIVGPIFLEKSHPALTKLLRSSKPGQIQAPIPIEKHFVIIRVESLDAAKLDDNMRENMVEELFNEWINSQVDELSSKLLEHYN